MSIKQSIAFLILFLGVSFSAYAGYWNHQGTNKRFPTTSAVDSYVKDTWNNTTPNGEADYVKYYDCYFAHSGSSGTGKCKRTGTSRVSNVASFYYFDSNICPDGQELIGDECQVPPPPPFCSQESTQQQIKEFEAQCAADGGNSTVVCNDLVSPPDFRMSCDIPPPPPEGCEPGSPSWPACLEDENKCDENHPDWNPEYGMCCNANNDYCDVPAPESCTIFSPNWPECAGDTDITPPTGGDLTDPDKPDGGGSGNPDPDKPEPDVEENTDSTKAIEAMNRDLNKQLTDINNDLNKNHAESKSSMDALKASVDLNTDTIVDSSNHLKGAIENQTGALTDTGNKTNQLLTSANNLLNGGFAQLSNGLGDLNSTNTNGFQGVIDAIEGIEGVGDIPLVSTGGAEAAPLFDVGTIAGLNAEVSALKNEYEQVLNDFKQYFNPNHNTQSGDFNPHNISLNWHGVSIDKNNQSLVALKDNSGVIAAVVLFIFGMLGIRSIVGSL